MLEPSMFRFPTFSPIPPEGSLSSVSSHCTAALVWPFPHLLHPLFQAYPTHFTVGPARPISSTGFHMECGFERTEDEREGYDMDHGDEATHFGPVPPPILPVARPGFSGVPKVLSFDPLEYFHPNWMHTPVDIASSTVHQSQSSTTSWTVSPQNTWQDSQISPPTTEQTWSWGSAPLTYYPMQAQGDSTFQNPHETRPDVTTTRAQNWLAGRTLLDSSGPNSRSFSQPNDVSMEEWAGEELASSAPVVLTSRATHYEGSLATSCGQTKRQRPMQPSNRDLQVNTSEDTVKSSAPKRAKGKRGTLTKKGRSGGFPDLIAPVVGDGLKTRRGERWQESSRFDERVTQFTQPRKETGDRGNVPSLNNDDSPPVETSDESTPELFDMMTLSPDDKSRSFGFLDLLSGTEMSVKAGYRRIRAKSRPYRQFGKWIRDNRSAHRPDIELYITSKATKVTKVLYRRVEQQSVLERRTASAFERLMSGRYSQNKTRKRLPCRSHLQVFLSAAKELPDTSEHDNPVELLQRLRDEAKADPKFKKKVRERVLEAAYEDQQSSEHEHGRITSAS